MSANDTANALSAAQKSSPLNTTPLAGSKRKVRDDDTDTDSTPQNRSAPPARPLKKARSPSYKPNPENVMKTTPSVLGKRSREDTVPSEDPVASELLPWDDVSHIPPQLRERAKKANENTIAEINKLKAISDRIMLEESRKLIQSRARDANGNILTLDPLPAWPPPPDLEQELLEAEARAVEAELEREHAKEEALEKELRDSQEAAAKKALSTKAAKIAFNKAMLGITDAEPPAPLLSKHNVPQRDPRCYVKRKRPPPSLFFARTSRDVDRPDGKPINRRINFEDDELNRDPSVYRNPVAYHTLTTREVHEVNAVQRAADAAELQADLETVRRAQAKREWENRGVAEPVIHSISEVDEMAEIVRSSPAKVKSPKSVVNGMVSKSSPKKQPAASKDTENKDVNTLTPGGSVVNSAGTANTPINIIDDDDDDDDDGGAGVGVGAGAPTGGGPAVQTSGAERAKKDNNKDDEAKKARRAEEARKKKERAQKVASWHSAVK